MSRLKPYPNYKDSGVEWLGKVPEHWKVDSARWSVTKCQNGVWGSDPRNDGTDVPCVRVADFDRQKLIAGDDVPTLRSVSELEHRTRGLNTGNLLLEKSGGGENQPVGAVVLYTGPTGAVCSNFMARMELTPESDPSFWRYMHSTLYSARINTRSIKQTSGIQNLDQQSYLQERVPFPPLSEQTRISGELDKLTQRIDTLIDKKTRFIELLKEKRHAVVTHVVTKGLNPNTPMKDSGFEWLGEVPALWDVAPLKRNLERLTSGSRGWASYYSDDGDIFIRIGNLSRDSIELKLSDICRVSPPIGAEGERTRVASGDVLFSITAYLGSVAVVPNGFPDAFVSQHVALARLKGDCLRPKWVAFYVLSGAGQAYLNWRGYGGTKIQLSLEDIADFPIPTPSLDDQDKILSVLSDAIGKLDQLMVKTQRSIELLRERRSAIITAAVTGKVDLRDAA